MSEPLSPEALEAALRAIGAERYHNHHPFHRLLHSGKLNQGQVQAWALNRYYYQSRIPIKDSAFLARAEDPILRREWISRVLDHDGDGTRAGGIERWLRLAEGVGLDRADVAACKGVLPAVRFAVDAYIDFVHTKPLVEAVASSLTELFAPTIINERVTGMLAHYEFVSPETLAYFNARLTEAPKDSAFALDYVKTHAVRTDQQAGVLAALRFKCDVLWAQLDALYHAYIAPGHVPIDGFRPEA